MVVVYRLDKVKSDNMAFCISLETIPITLSHFQGHSLPQAFSNVILPTRR